MTGMHHMLAHFPVAFWALASLMILVGVLARGRAADLCRAALLPVLVLGVLGALASLLSGYGVWSLEALLHSPLTRNHLLMAFWSLAVYLMLLVLVWVGGRDAFSGLRGLALAVLGLLGAWLFALTGTLGGHLAGAPTVFSALPRLLGWELYTTFYAPTWVLGVMVLLAIAAAVLGFRRMKRRRG
ncbi:heme ABC transporter permease [Halomonas stenophila]|uniref:Heme ABC transporter permease n=1 Tax=Halomonas stenophila TaxID=795312 RepID=A0A7W5EQ45_9GAMM|nr:heme ABC transporter permease [Halomonas stenophila]MBB3229403.1 hypothetical protein [Halomonas stenophila]